MGICEISDSFTKQKHVSTIAPINGRNGKRKNKWLSYDERMNVNDKNSNGSWTDTGRQPSYSDRTYDTPKYLSTRKASKTPIQVTTWAIPDCFAKGELTTLAGPKATGKSTMYCAIAAAVSRGGSHPSWLGKLNQEPGGVLIMSSEDDFERTIIPRLMVAGADLDRIEHIDGINNNGGNSGAYTFNQIDDERIENTARNMGGVSLIVIDPWTLVIDGDVKNGIKVQRKLEKISYLAKRLNAAILIIAHVSKNSKGRDPITRVAGSAAVTDVARGLFITAKIENGPKDDGSTHILVRTATNLGKVGGGFSYSIREEIASSNGISVPTSKIVWHTELPGTPEDILYEAEKTKKVKELGAPEKAAIFLHEILSKGPLPFPKILIEATKAGLSEISLIRGKKLLNISCKKQMNAGSASPFIWTLLD